jgi:hypothetical protein
VEEQYGKMKVIVLWPDGYQSSEELLWRSGHRRLWYRVSLWVHGYPIRIGDFTRSGLDDLLKSGVLKL